MVNFATKARHAEEKAETDFISAGAGERCKRSAHSIPSCRKQNGDLLLVLGGDLRGYPLDALLVTFLAREKSPVGDWTRRRADSFCLRRSRMAEFEQTDKLHSPKKFFQKMKNTC